MTVEQLKEQFNVLSPEERAELALFLLRSIEPDEQQVEAAWREELKRRAAEIKSGKAIGIPAEEVHARLREKLK